MNDRRYLIVGIPLLSLLITVINDHGAGPRTLPHFLVDWGVALIYTTAFWLSNRALWLWLLRRLPRVEQTARRLWLLAGLAVLLTSAVSLAFYLIVSLLLLGQGPFQFLELLKQIRFSLVPTGIALLIYESVRFFQQWEQNVRRAEQLGRAGTQAQLDALRGQLDPHFLFNNLNTLAALIEPENAPAQNFVEQLADVYRYVLLSQGQPTVPLAEELAFVETYLALHKVRFRDNLRVEIDLAPAALARRVAPLSVQLLVENALKHNVATASQPLHLCLRADAEADYLTVENTLRPRPAGLAPGTGTGLANVRQRYALLGAAQPVEVRVTNEFFAVRLPLIPA